MLGVDRRRNRSFHWRPNCPGARERQEQKCLEGELWWVCSCSNRRSLVTFSLCDRSRRQLRISMRPLSFEIGARQRAKLTGAVVVTCPGNQVGDGQVGPRCCRSDPASSQASNCPQAYAQGLWRPGLSERAGRLPPGRHFTRPAWLGLRYPTAAHFSSQTDPRACRMRPRGTPAAVGASGPLAGCRRARVRCRVSPAGQQARWRAQRPCRRGRR